MEAAGVSDRAQREEAERRELAQTNAGDVVAGSGRALAGRRLGQMVSVRLEPELVAELRGVAGRRGVSLSDLLRDGARLVIAADAAPRPQRISVTKLVAGAVGTVFPNIRERQPDGAR